jgi:hypothetical protein
LVTKTFWWMVQKDTWTLGDQNWKLWVHTFSNVTRREIPYKEE